MRIFTSDYIFPVVSDPIDVVGDLEPPADSEFAEGLEEIGQSIKDFLDKVGDWFKSVGEWFKTNWKWIVLAIGIIVGLVILVLVIKLFVAIRGNRVKIKVDSPPASSKRSTSRKSARRKT